MQGQSSCELLVLFQEFAGIVACSSNLVPQYYIPQWNLKKVVYVYIFLQTQYVFIHNALDELVTCGDTEIAAVNMRITISKFSRTVKGSENISGFQKLFEVCIKRLSQYEVHEWCSADSG